MDPCGTPVVIQFWFVFFSIHVYILPSITEVTFHHIMNRTSISIFFHFCNKILWSNVSNVFCRSMKQACPRDFLSISLLMNSVIDTIASLQDLFDRNPYWLPVIILFFSQTLIMRDWSNFSNTLLIELNKLIGRQFSFFPLSPSLNIGMIFAILRHFGNVRSSMHLLKAAAIAGSITSEQHLRNSLLTPSTP